MKTLTSQLAEQIAREKFNNIVNEEDREWQIIHSKSVAEIDLILTEKKNVDKDILIIAGWLHDLGRMECGEEHAKKSIEILEREGYELDEKLKDCILEHGTNGNLKTEEGKIIKVADKVSFLNPELVSLAVKYSDNGKVKQDYLNFFKKASLQAIELLEKLGN